MYRQTIMVIGRIVESVPADFESHDGDLPSPEIICEQFTDDCYGSSSALLLDILFFFKKLSENHLIMVLLRHCYFLILFYFIFYFFNPGAAGHIRLTVADYISLFSEPQTIPIHIRI
jgi:hypothetical protein